MQLWSRRSAARRRVIGWSCIALLLFQVGCHSYLPMRTDLPVSTGGAVGIILNDQGRFRTGQRLGVGIDRVEGVVLAQNDSVIKLGVSGTRTLQGTRTTWTGEEVEIPRIGIAGFQERQFSRRRTSVLVASLLVGLVVVGGLLGLSVGGLGFGGGDGTCSSCPEQ